MASPKQILINVSEADFSSLGESAEHVAEDVNVKFFPPVYVQRYTTVQSVIASAQYRGKIKKVVDFGCAELAFAIHLKNTEGIEEIICVDIDRSLLENFQSKVAPLHCDYLSLRTEPLTIHVCEGSIAHNDNRFANSDAVVCIELIEHLYPDDLEAFPYNVFGFIKPLVVIVTTPNADFNVLFKLNGFRHYDHKFEWTREQFQDWANNIVLRYPDYEVTFHGIGAGPLGTENLGSCSQMAVFHRHNQLYNDKIQGVDGLLKTVVSHEYPYRADNRSDEEKILEDSVYYIRLYSARDEELSEEFPLKTLQFLMDKYHITVEILRNILEEAHWAIVDRENGPVVLIPPQTTFSSNSEVDFDDFLEADYRVHHTEDRWDTLGPGAPSDYLFDSYMEGDTHEHEEENWDDEVPNTQQSNISNVNSESLAHSELQESENLDHTSDSQWTIEDLNNDDLLYASQNQPTTTFDLVTDLDSDWITSHSFVTEMELPSSSFSIELNRADVDYSNSCSDTVNSSKQDLGWPGALSASLDASSSLGAGSSHLLSTDRKLTSSNDKVKKLPQTGKNNTSSYITSDGLSNFESFTNRSDQRSLKSSVCEDGTNLVKCNDNAVKEQCHIELETDANQSETGSNNPNHFQHTNTNIASNSYNNPQRTNSPLFTQNSPNFPQSEAENSVDYRLAHKNTSSILTEEATLLISYERNENDSPIARESLGDELFPNSNRKRLKQSVSGTVQTPGIATLSTDQPLSRENLYHDLNNTHLQASSISHRSLDTTVEAAYQDSTGSALATHENNENLDVLYDSMDHELQKCKTGLIDKHKFELVVIKNQDDSISFKSISNCSLDLQPKYTSSPQVAKEFHLIQSETQVENKSLSDEQSLGNHESDYAIPRVSQNIPSSITTEKSNKNTKQSNDSFYENEVLQINISTRDQDTLCKKTASEGGKVNEKKSLLHWPDSKSAENMSPNTSQLSLYSNSDINLSTTTSNESSNMDKWYAAETNPMYQRDLVLLKGGNDTADNPIETISDSETMFFGNDKCKEPKSSRINDDEIMGNHCHGFIKTNKSQDTTNQMVNFSKLEIVISSQVDLLLNNENDELPCENFLTNHGMNNVEINSSQNGIAQDSMSLQTDDKNDISLEQKTVLNLESISSSNASGSSAKKETANAERKSNTETEIVTESVSCNEHAAPTSSNMSKSVLHEENSEHDVHKVTTTLTEFNQVAETKSDLEPTLETTKKVAKIISLGDVDIRTCIAQHTNGAIENDVEPHENTVNLSLAHSQHTSGSKSFVSLNAIGKHSLPVINNLGSTTSQKNKLQYNLNATIGREVSTSYNLSRVAQERSQLKCELEPSRTSENVDSQPFSPESLDTPPNSWSPEIMDSGYPNSASVHDITPEYDLSSIANDRISDSDSASIGEVPMPGFYEFIEVENGDLANNNRDDEGNNVIAFEADHLDDLQPLIDVLEHDIENENDIYVLQNGFPMWLLRILEMANPIDLEGMGGPQAQLHPALPEQAGGDAQNVNVDNDEGFDSSSSDDESDIGDDEAGDATTISSDETDDHSAENISRDWRAGGDP